MLLLYYFGLILIVVAVVGAKCTRWRSAQQPSTLVAQSPMLGGA
jgi:hypothetical protein